jgi:hypothetical protein
VTPADVSLEEVEEALSYFPSDDPVEAFEVEGNIYVRKRYEGCVDEDTNAVFDVVWLIGERRYGSGFPFARISHSRHSSLGLFSLKQDPEAWWGDPHESTPEVLEGQRSLFKQWADLNWQPDLVF